MLRRMMFATATALLTLPALAQDTTTLAQEYVNMPQVQNMITEMFSPAAMGAQVVAGLPPNVTVNADQQQRIGTLMSDAMNDIRPRMEALMISGSAEVFSVEELRALIDFYGSEHGASVMTKMTPFMTNVMGRLAPEMQALQQKITPQLIQILQEK